MSVMNRPRFALVIALFTASSAGAQAPRGLAGLVRDSAGHGISGAEVRARGDVVVAFSDDSGRFRVAQMPVGARGVFVRRLGFAPHQAAIRTSASGTIDSVDVVLTVVVHQLPGVVAMEPHDSLSRKVLAEFWARRAHGFGKFVTRDEIQQKGASRFVDVVRSVSGVSILSYRGRPEIRFRGAVTSAFRDCPPQYWVDGMPLERGSADEFSPDNVEAIELYASPATTPPQFSTRSQTCGTVVIWSRLPG
jgi:carboxypeptidase family protein/TonB-dependent receptor-like protein